MKNWIIVILATELAIALSVIFGNLNMMHMKVWGIAMADTAGSQFLFINVIIVHFLLGIVSAFVVVYFGTVLLKRVLGFKATPR